MFKEYLHDRNKELKWNWRADELIDRKEEIDLYFKGEFYGRCSSYEEAFHLLDKQNAFIDVWTNQSRFE
ncbi:hypothetical protein ACFO4L_15225 [Bacillus daqingensis]|uniref:Uncharacterized protein n=1 Tax=Bacillus daqingensis TaxID=872396 RepID=A0ABV9NYI7_9BACI